MLFWDQDPDNYFEESYSSVVKIQYVTYTTNVRWFMVKYVETCSYGGTGTLLTGVKWYNDAMTEKHMNIDKETNSRYESGNGSVKEISCRAGDRGFTLQTVEIKVYAYDLKGNETKLVDYSQRSTRRPNQTWDVSSMFSSVNTETPVVYVKRDSKAAVNIPAYGATGRLSGVQYTTNYSPDAVKVDGDALLLDGTKLGVGTHTIKVYAHFTPGNSGANADNYNVKTITVNVSE